MKLFVDNKRKVNQLYSDPDNWDQVTTITEYRKYLNEKLSQGKIPTIISFEYDLEKDKEGLECLKELINISTKLKLQLPKIYLHCRDRNLAIDFENELNHYTRKTNIPYNFEYTKQN